MCWGFFLAPEGGAQVIRSICHDVELCAVRRIRHGGVDGIQQALEDLSDCYDGDDDYDGECASCHTRSYLPHDADCKRNNAVNALRAALKREEEALAWLEERKQHWKRERERMQDPELSAALGYPGGISDPVLNRVELLRMVAEMRLAQLAAPQ